MREVLIEDATINMLKTIAMIREGWSVAVSKKKSGLTAGQLKLIKTQRKILFSIYLDAVKEKRINFNRRMESMRSKNVGDTNQPDYVKDAVAAIREQIVRAEHDKTKKWE